MMKVGGRSERPVEDWILTR